MLSGIIQWAMTTVTNFTVLRGYVRLLPPADAYNTVPLSDSLCSSAVDSILCRVENGAMPHLGFGAARQVWVPYWGEQFSPCPEGLNNSMYGLTSSGADVQ